MYLSPEELAELLQEHMVEGDFTYEAMSAFLRREGYVSRDGRPLSTSNLKYLIKKYVPWWKNRPAKPRPKGKKWEEYERLAYPLPVECRYPAPTQEEQRIGTPFYDVCPYTNTLA